MKRRCFYWLLVITIVFTMLSGVKAVYASNNPYYDMIKKYQGKVTDQEYMQLEVWSSYMPDYYQEFYDNCICSGALGRGSEGVVTEILLKEGYYTEYFDQIKAAGLVSPDFQLPSSTAKADNNSEQESSTPVVSATSIPKEVTTTKCDEKIMWAKSQVNVREKGSTDFKKVGTLNKGEQVTVTGIDSTGWYEIRKSDGTIGHVSDKYLTEENPSVKTTPEEKTEDEITKRESEIISIDGRTVVWYNAETGEEEEVVFSDNTPLEEVENMAMKYLINGADLVEQITEETTPTEVVAETEEATEEPAQSEVTEHEPEVTADTSTVEEPIEVENDTEEPQDNTEKMREFVQGPIFIFGSIIIGLLAFIGGIVTIIINRKRR